MAKDANGQLRLSSDILQKAVLMATQGGQIENLPQSGLIIANSPDSPNVSMPRFIDKNIWQ